MALENAELKRNWIPLGLSGIKCWYDLRRTLGIAGTVAFGVHWRFAGGSVGSSRLWFAKRIMSVVSRCSATRVVCGLVKRVSGELRMVMETTMKICTHREAASMTKLVVTVREVEWTRPST